MISVKQLIILIGSFQEDRDSIDSEPYKEDNICVIFINQLKLEM